MEVLRRWWATTPDYQWLLRYHQSHPFLRYSSQLNALFGLAFAFLCVGLLMSPGIVVGTVQRVVVGICTGLALTISLCSLSRRFENHRASIVIIAGSDLGIAAVLLSITPSTYAILGSTVFTGIGNYAASFHGARVFVCHYAWKLAVLSALFVNAEFRGDSPTTTNVTAVGLAAVVLFTSSVVLQALVAQLRHDSAGAYFDALTGLRNRRGLQAALVELGRAHTHTTLTVWVIIVDLDGFKLINDRYGHDHGDDVLRRTASRIDAAAPKPLVSARIGGEEFTVIGTGTALSARECAEHIVELIHGADDKTPVTASLGVAIGSCSPTDADAADVVSLLMTRADVAMYEAKRLGGDRVMIADPSA